MYKLKTGNKTPPKKSEYLTMRNKTKNSMETLQRHLNYSPFVSETCISCHV